MKYEKKKVMIIYIIYTMIFGVKLIGTRHSKVCAAAFPKQMEIELEEYLLQVRPGREEQLKITSVNETTHLS